MSEITVTFDENIDKNTVDAGSLSVFVNSGTGDYPNVDSVSVSSKTATFKISPSTASSNTLTPGVTYIASISTSIEDQNGNFLDCFNSKGVDYNCEWTFTAGSSSAVPPAPSIVNPQSGTVTNDNTPNVAGTTLGGLHAIKTVGTYFTSTSLYDQAIGYNSKTFKVLRVVTILKNQNSFLDITYWADKSNFNDFLPTVEKMIGSFALINPHITIQEEN